MSADNTNPWIVWAKFRRNRLATGSAVVILLLVLLTIGASWVAPRDPLYIDMAHKFARPGEAGFLLGADELGRDVLSRLLHAGRVSLAVGLVTALIAVLVGSMLGGVAGYYGGAADAFIMRLADVLLFGMNPKVSAFSTVGFDQIASMTAADDLTLKIKMKQAYAPIFVVLADMFIVPEHILSKSPDINKDEFNTRRPVGTGPFKFVEWLHKTRGGEHVYRAGAA